MFTEQSETAAATKSSEVLAAEQHKGADFEAWWRASIHDGVVPGTVLPTKTPSLSAGGSTEPRRRRSWRRRNRLPARPAVLRRPLRQQRLAAGTPEPLTKITWTTPPSSSPRDKQRLGFTENSGENSA